LQQQLETAQRDECERSELQRKANSFSEEAEEAKQVSPYMATNLIESKIRICHV